MAAENHMQMDLLFEKDIKQGESQEVEFKEDYPLQASDLAKEIAAFATSNSGRIYLGISDDGTICGSSLCQREGRDSLQTRIAGVCQKVVQPAIIAPVEFIEGNGKTVVRISVPKGTEPVYYSNRIAYVRNLSTAVPATADQMKELFRQYFLSHPGDQETSGEEQVAFLRLLEQLSDFQILWFDHEMRQVNPDLQQMRYDLGQTGRNLTALSTDAHLEKAGLADQLAVLGNSLEDLERFQFYMDGGQSWSRFCEVGDATLRSVETLLAIVAGGLRIDQPNARRLAEHLRTSLLQVKTAWGRRQQYLNHNELPILKEFFRTHAFAFNRLAYLLSASEAGYSDELRQLARDIRTASALDYRVGLGFNPLNAIEATMTEALTIIDRMLSRIPA